MAETASGFWYPDPGTSYSSNGNLATLASSIEAKVGPSIVDTGWVNCTYRAGYTAGTPGQLRVRQVGKIIYFQGGATGSFLNGVYTQVATIPTGFRPGSTFRGGAFGQAGRAAGIEISSAGTVIFAHTNPSNPPWISASISYPL